MGKRTCRRDDLVSVIFIMILICKPGSHPFSRYDGESDHAYFKQMKCAKRHSPWLMVDLKGMYWLRDMASDIGSVKYYAEPHYSKYKFALEVLILTLPVWNLRDSTYRIGRYNSEPESQS